MLADNKAAGAALPAGAARWPQEARGYEKERDKRLNSTPAPHRTMPAALPDSMSTAGANPLEPPKIPRDEQNLTVAYIQFLRQKVSVNDCNPDQAEAIEVAVQCLESAFGLSYKNHAYQPVKPLLETFKGVEGVSDSEEFPSPTAAIEQANKLKEQGNELVKALKFQEAVKKYNAAIKLNRDPIYLCDLAYAYNRLEQYSVAIQTALEALVINPKCADGYLEISAAFLHLNLYETNFAIGSLTHESSFCEVWYEMAVEAAKKAAVLVPHCDKYQSALSAAKHDAKAATREAKK
ncbi:SGTA-dimer domain-containing protein [Aphelenchoides fujianensis]|nr:SGTA-dimer domain-containing protein [Aphelenchoides fujianensis]